MASRDLRWKASRRALRDVRGDGAVSVDDVSIASAGRFPLRVAMPERRNSTLMVDIVAGVWLRTTLVGVCPGDLWVLGCVVDCVLSNTLALE